MRLLITICGLLFLKSCSGQQNLEFQELRNKLPLVKTPISFPRDFGRIPNVEIPNNQIISFLRKKFELRHFPFFLGGKLFESRTYIAIVGAVNTPRGTPIIIVFNNKGEQIDSLAVYHDMSGTVIDSTGVEQTFNFGYVFPDRLIKSVDSTISMDVKMVQGIPIEKPETQTFSVQTRKYKISDKGKIESVD